MRLIIIAMLIFSIEAIAQSAQTTLRIDKVSDNTGTIFGLRLNENNDRNSKSPDAEIECNRPDGVFLIGFCDDGYCETEFDGDIFYNFYSQNERDCYKVQNEIKRIVKNGQGACLKKSGNSLTVKAIKKYSGCI